MTGNDYQKLAARTIATSDSRTTLLHSLLGVASEVGELLGLYQKRYQGHLVDEEHAMKEVGDILWMVAEYCTVMGWDLEDVMQLNIDKLLLRYPNGFETERSLKRKKDDI